MNYYKVMRSDRSESESSSQKPSVTASDHSSQRGGLLGKRKFQRVRNLFVQHLGAYQEGELKKICLDYNFVEDGLVITTWSKPQQE